MGTRDGGQGTGVGWGETGLSLEQEQGVTKVALALKATLTPGDGEWLLWAALLGNVSQPAKTNYNPFVVGDPVNK